MKQFNDRAGNNPVPTWRWRARRSVRRVEGEKATRWASLGRLGLACSSRHFAPRQVSSCFRSWAGLTGESRWVMEPPPLAFRPLHADFCASPKESVLQAAPAPGPWKPHRTVYVCPLFPLSKALSLLFFKNKQNNCFCEKGYLPVQLSETAAGRTGTEREHGRSPAPLSGGCVWAFNPAAVKLH